MQLIVRFLLALVLANAYVHALAQSRAAAAAIGDESRLALVIGNSTYKDSPLINPVNDANAMAKALESLGFKVILQTNASRSQMRQALRRFGDQLQASRGVGLFYFAGHGVQINARNYLVPVGTDIQREYEVEDEAIDAASVLSLMQAAKARVNIVILDACRNNPYARSFRNSINGLAPMQPVGTLLAYATAPGEVANDGAGDNGLYTQHLLKNVSIPGLKIEDVFKNVRAGVSQDSGGKQTPWENTSLVGEFYFRIAVTVNVQPVSPGMSREEVESAVSAALAKREQDEALRRRTQLDEIERAVQAALRKREEEAVAAQTSRQTQDAQAARVAIERLTQELAELKAARGTQTKPTTQPAVPPPAIVTASGKSTTSAVPDPQRLALAAPTTQPIPSFTVGQPVEKPDVVAGNRWRYQVTDLYTGIKQYIVMEVQSVTENRIYTQSAPVNVAYSSSGVQGGTVQVWDRSWNLLRNGGTDYSSPYPEMQFPLANGKKWNNEVNYPFDDGDWRQQASGQVVGWEKLTVPAGTFDVVKIEIRGFWNFSGSTRGAGAFTEVLYYSPLTRQVVKREIERSSPRGPNFPGSYSIRERWELTEFSK